jgi:(p)ppGpp synthase/HD superfamily hydrolase
VSAYSSKFDEAVALAVDAFRPVRRKGVTTPYITHLFAVTALVGEAGGDEEQMIAAVLHDLLEDIPDADVSDLEARFGSRVARLVAALSDSVGSPKPAWRIRKEQYLAHLREQPAEVKLVSCADKLHNASSLVRDLRHHGPSTFARFNGGRDGTLWYYGEVHQALGHRWDHWLVHELGASVASMQALAGGAP